MDPWAKIVSGYDELTRIEIPEWGEEDQPFVAFSRPATVEDEIAVRRVVKQIDSPETWARLVFNKLLNEDGSRVFEGKPFAEFKRKAPGGLIKRIGQSIYLGQMITEADAEGN